MAVEEIGAYQLVEKIAEGGMGIVYKAVNTETQKIAAVKTLKDQYDKNSETFIRFKKEANLLEQLDHPNILKFIDFQEKNSRVYIITEFIEGKNLKTIALDPQIPLNEKVSMLLQIAEALDYVHSQGIIHRDIKPSNIMVLNEGSCKILDFGVANLMNFQKIFTSKTGVAGSLAYMSPEQSGILKRNIDTRSDLYSLGILGYELLTGVLPFQAKEVGELLHQHIARIPEEPINLVPKLSPIINKIILKLIKKDPDERYQTAFGLAEDLKVYLKLNDEQKQTFYLELGKKDRLKNLNYSTRLIGREKELSHLLDHLNNTVLGKGFVTCIIGRSGMGKSRLTSELQKFTRSKNAFFIPFNSVERNSNFPFFPLIECVKKIIDTLYKMPLHTQEEVLASLRTALGPKGIILSKIIPEMTPIAGKYDPHFQFHKKESDLFFEKLKDFFITLSSTAHPLILNFDNIHFWDQGTIQFFDYFKDFIPESSVYMVLSVREDLALQIEGLYEIIKKQAQEGNLGILTLQPLKSDDIGALVEEIFGTLYSGIQELSSRLHESTQGNPLLIVENIKTLVEEKIVVQKKDGWWLDLEKLTMFRFSSSIADKILSRLLKTSSSAKEILGYAAILGKDFNYSILHPIVMRNMPQLGQETLVERLKEALDVGLIAETLSEKGEITYSFVHDKVIETLLAQIPEKKRREIHCTAGEMLEAESDNRDKIYDLAYHYLMGGKRNKAYLYNLRAGAQALSDFSFRLAVDFYYNALGIVKQFAKHTVKALQSRISLSLNIVNINFQLGEFKNNIELLEELLPLVTKINDQPTHAKILYQLGKNNYFLGEQAKAMAYYSQVIPIAESLHIPELLGIPYCSLGRANSFIAKFKEAIIFLEKGLPHLPAEEELEQIYAYGGLAQAHAAIGSKKRALELTKVLEEKFLSVSNEMHRMYAQFFLASTHTMMGDPERALRENEKAYAMARELRNPIIETNALFNLGRTYSNLGKTEEAIKYMSRSITLAKEHKIFLGLFMLIFTLAENYVWIGNVGIARDTLKDGEQYIGISNPELAAQWKKRLEALFEIASHSPDIYQALEYINEAIATSESMGHEYQFLTMHNNLVKAGILWKMDKGDEAQRLFEEVIRFFKEHELTNDLRYAESFKDNFFTFFEKLHNDENDFSMTHTMTGTQSEFSYQRQLRYLLKLSEQLAKVHTMDALMPTIMSLAIEVSGAERGMLFLYESPDQKNSSLLVKAQKSIDPKEEKSAMVYSDVALQKTLSTGKGQLVMDAEQELSEDSHVLEYKLKSIITVPLITSGKILGCIHLDNRQVKGLFTKENFEILKAFAIEAAISIENAKLYERVQEQARVEHEMEIAKDIQTSILPSIKDNAHYSISAFMRTATEVGGDYYDFDLTKPPYFGVFGDVAGHGLRSGLVMMMAEVAFNMMTMDDDLKLKPLPDLYQKINLTLFRNIQERLSQKSATGNQYSHLYMTFRLFRFSPEGDFEMFGNDHAEPFICRAATGDITAIPSTGFLMGIAEDAIIDNDSFHFKLEKDDLLILYSDGITEAKQITKDEYLKTREARAMYGEERLFNIIQENRHKEPKEIIAAVMSSVEQWMAEQEDDITLAIIKKK